MKPAWLRDHDKNITPSEPLDISDSDSRPVNIPDDLGSVYYAGDIGENIEKTNDPFTISTETKPARLD